jgi:hypothetical protein
MSFLFELLSFLKARKKYWLFPIVTVMVMVGVVLMLSEVSAVAPFIYTLF